MTAAYRIYNNIQYGPDPTNQVLDLYQPRKLTSQMPIAVIHGGGFVAGTENKYNAVVVAEALANLGFLNASLRYTLDNPDQAVADCQVAIQWLRANAPQYKCLSNVVGAIGGSAGACITEMLAITGNPGDTKIELGIACSGPTTHDLDNSFGTGLMWADPANQVLSPAVSPLLIYNSANEIIPLAEAQYLYTRLLDAGDTNVQLIVLPGTTHAFLYWSTIKTQAVNWFRTTEAAVRAALVTL